MSLSHQEAASALQDIAKTERRSFSAYGYKAAAPHLILWGVVWFGGYIGTYLFPAQSDWVWPAFSLIGAAISTLTGMYSKPRGSVKFSWRIFFTWLAALGAIASVLAIFSPFNGMQIGSLFPLVIGWSYAIMGIWMGWRFIVAGLAIVALTLFSFFRLPPEQFLLCMAFLGGVILIGTGLWLRRA
jgi:hypothetical protein